MASEENKDPDWIKLVDREKYKHYEEKGFYRLTGAQKPSQKILTRMSSTFLSPV